MIRAALHDFDSKHTHFGALELLEAWEPGKGWIWLDIDHEELERDEAVLKRRFNIHALAIADAKRKRHPPKYEDFGSHQFVLLRDLDAETRDINHRTIQTGFFIAADFLVTVRSETSASIDGAWEELIGGEAVPAASPAAPALLACRIARLIVDRYSPVLQDMEMRLEEMEEEMFTVSNDRMLEELFNYNRNLKQIRRTMVYHTNVFRSLLAQKSPVTHSVQHELNDLFEHFERLSSLSALFQELVVDLINGYLSLSSHRLNRIMKILTIFTVIFLPLTLLVGVYGMNFSYMPELEWHYGYFFALGLMGAVVAGSLTLFRRLKWL